MARMDMTRLDAAVARFGDIQIRGSANEAVPAAEKLGREAKSEEQLRRWLADRDIQGGTPAFKAAIKAFDAKNTRGDAGGRTPSQKEERAFENGEAAAKRGVAMASPPYTRGSPEYIAWLAGFRSAEKKRGDAGTKKGDRVTEEWDGKQWNEVKPSSPKKGPRVTQEWTGSEWKTVSRADAAAKLDAAIARMDATVRRVTARQLAQKFRDGEWSAMGDITRGGYQEVQSTEDKKRFTVEVTDHKA